MARPRGCCGLADRSNRAAEFTAPHETMKTGASTRVISPPRCTSTASTRVPSRDVSSRRARACVQSVTPRLHGWPHTAHIGVALAVDAARERVAGVAQLTPVRETRIHQPEGQRRGMQPLALEPRDHVQHRPGMRHRRIRIRAARRLGGIRAGVAVHVVQPLGGVVPRSEILVGDRPRGRDAVDVLEFSEVLAPQTIEHAAPELRVAADVVVRVRLELGTGLIDPALRRAVAQFLPDRGRTPVLGLGRHAAATLDQEDALARRRQGVGHRSAARAGPDDHEVECVAVHVAAQRASTGVVTSGALAMIWSIRRWSSRARSSRISGGAPVRMLARKSRYMAW